jgi:outer membrane lipoprotein-sorting protein
MTKILTTTFLFLFLLTQFSYGQVVDAKAKSILDKVAAKAKTYTNMKFDFSYRMIDKAHDVDNKLNGTIVMQGDMYNLHMMGRQVVSDATTVWSFSPDDEEIQVNNADASKNAFSFLKLLTSVNDDYSAKLIKTVKEGSKSFYIVDLVPVKAQSYYKIRLKIDKAENWVNEATIFQKDNQEYIFTVVKFVANLKLPSNYFKFDVTKYPDADVVDLR